jgi:hypothetical protein
MEEDEFDIAIEIFHQSRAAFTRGSGKEVAKAHPSDFASAR